VEVDLLPLSPELRAALAAGGQEVADFPLSGGEDYELLFTVSPERSREVVSRFAAAGAPLTRIGEITTGELLLKEADGVVHLPRQRGYDHFA
jgi:thiamine-monophosphate kinase